MSTLQSDPETTIRTERVPAELTDTSHNLLLSPTTETVAERACLKLTTHTSVHQTNLMAVTLTHAPDQYLDAWPTQVDPSELAKTVIVTAGETVRSVAIPDSSPTIHTGPVLIETVPDAASVVDLGTVITEYLSEWADDTNQSTICFHALTDLFQSIEEPRIFRFLHALLGRVDSFGARSFVQMDPAFHEDATVQRFSDMMDAVIEYEDHNQWAVYR